jgi:hypothetical protein
MKSKYILTIILVAIMTSVMVSCSDDDGGTPSVSYVRVTDPAASDSLFSSAGQGSLIAIMGQNLGSVREIWFNDLQAEINPTFVNNHTILVHVPSLVPDVITNQMKLVFANGETLLYDFTVDINKPLLDHAKSEYLNEGDTLIIYGDYFYEPLTITFADDQPAEVMSVSTDSKTLMIKVPEVVPEGPIKVTSNFGTTVSNFWLQDKRNIIADFEGPFDGYWRGSDYVVASDPDIDNINGKFMRVKKGKQGAWPYMELFGGPADGGPALLTKNIPEAAFADPAGYSVKMEVNAVLPTTGIVMRIYLGSAPGSSFGDARNNIYYEWKPNVDSHGTWTTVTIPWKDVYAANQFFPYNSNGYGLYLYCHGPNAAFYDFAIDNIRVVPNKTKI